MANKKQLAKQRAEMKATADKLKADKIQRDKDNATAKEKEKIAKTAKAARVAKEAAAKVD